MSIAFQLLLLLVSCKHTCPFYFLNASVLVSDTPNNLNVKNRIEDGCAYDNPLPKTSSKTLAVVIEWCKKHVDKTAIKDELNKY